MKIILTTSFLLLFLNTILCSTSGAKVLPVIEGSELLDTLATQNNGYFNSKPELIAWNYKYPGTENFISPQNYFLNERLFYGANRLCDLSLLNISFDSILNIKSDNKTIFNRPK